MLVIAHEISYLSICLTASASGDLPKPSAGNQVNMASSAPDQASATPPMLSAPWHRPHPSPVAPQSPGTAQSKQCNHQLQPKKSVDQRPSASTSRQIQSLKQSQQPQPGQKQTWLPVAAAPQFNLSCNLERFAVGSPNPYRCPRSSASSILGIKHERRSDDATSCNSSGV